jgi:hypothetical protein
MANINSNYQEVRIPFAKMTFTPDVPSTALAPNEYNDGLNVETDVRGIRSMAGDQTILDALPAGYGPPTFVTGGFRQNGEFWFVVALTGEGATPGSYWASDGNTTWYNITPTDPTFDSSSYGQATNITEAWNGTVLFLNDEANPPFFWPDQPGAVMVSYSNQVPLEIDDITPATLTTKLVTFVDTQAVAPFAVGGYVSLTNVEPRYYNGTWEVTACTTTDVTIINNTTDAYLAGGEVAPAYSWNYNANWSNVFAKFMRLYNTPNVGSILVAGNLTATNVDTSAIELYPVTVQWSQAFGLNQAPTTWTPTVTNVANQLEVPLRGPALDAFPCNGQFFLCSYWDTVVFSPINYSTTAAPILGVRQFNQGRGLLSSNCWANTDKLVYGVDARDIWVFDGQDFQGLGTQRVKNWFYNELDPQYYDRVFMEVNSQRSQIEIYYPDSNAVGGVPNKMLSYRYDLDCWNAPRDISSATFSCEAPIFEYNAPNWDPLFASRTVVYAQGLAESQLVQKDQGFAFLPTGANPTGAITSVFRRDNIKLLKDYSGRLMVHRILPEVVNLGAIANESNEIPLYPATGNITVTIEGANSVGSIPVAKTPVTLAVDADGNAGNNPWAQINQNAFRVNTIELGDTSDQNIWMCSATTWQITQVEDDR